MNDFSGKKVAILGLGIEGEDLCRFLVKKKAEITVFDKKKASELGKQYGRFKADGIRFSLGRNYLNKNLNGFNMIFRSPGFRRLLPEIIEAEKRGVIISSATKLFFDLCPGEIVGVTGTKGKGTTASLIYEILKADGKKVFLAGNIGEPMLSLLPKITKDSRVILELSSFQLQDMKASPSIAVVLFITSEHMDYHRDQKEYVQAKSNLVRYQTRSDFAVLNADNKASSSFALLTKGRKLFFSRHKKVQGSYVENKNIYLLGKLVGGVSDLQLRGSHNWDNVCAAIAAGWAAGAGIKSIRKAVFGFKGLEHRLEMVRRINKVSFYNDSFSTTPETTMAAIRSFERPIILIAGGSEKGSDYAKLGKIIAVSTVKTLILIGRMAGRIKTASQKAGFKGKIVYQPKSMKEVVDLAFQSAQPGDVVLLSPACASFGMFENYKERGNQFKNDVRSIKYFRR